MKRSHTNLFIFLITHILLFPCAFAQSSSFSELKAGFTDPPAEAKPLVYWYWMRSAVTRAGITADLESMKEAGIGGAYLMTVRGTTNPPYIDPPVVPLSPEWWDLIRFTIQEADRNDIKLAMTPCDGWALAGGPWITPELSMQQIVWTKSTVNHKSRNITLPRPPAYKNYYREIAVYAYPAQVDEISEIPEVSSSTGTDVQYLAKIGNKKNFTSTDKCWIQFAFKHPICARSLTIKAHKNYQAMRLKLEVSDDGRSFKSIGRLKPPRHGWQDGDESITHSLGAIEARYFRLVYDPTGSEPGSEELDYAKWKPQLNVQQVIFSSEPKIDDYEGKSGATWRVSSRTTEQQIPDNLCVPLEKIIDISAYLGADGKLNWKVPPGTWNILRMGYTSTGKKNAAAGAATGLECDKFNPEAAKVQFNGWFAKALEQNTLAQVGQVINMFHVDSWECGSQNWSPVFAAEFKKRRGYDILNYLPVMAGVPVESADISERVLSDVRQTIAELVNDNFFGTLNKLAHEKGCTFSAEATAPTMAGDGILHFDNVDIPMGEFWFRSPTHDKPNDILDAVSGGHIYGKNIIQAEAFTELRLMWDEHPGMLKTLADRSFATGINRLVLHVNAHNPWLDRKPGMTLDGIGSFFQRDQTWWKPGKSWISYLQRCQYMLQQGKPVVDIAVFTGDEIPRRAILPEKLVNIFPGILGADRVKQEKERLKNEGIPIRTVTEGYPAVANLADPATWLDPLHGYKYDSVNPDPLLRLAKVHDGKIEFADGIRYGALVIPGVQSLSPDNVISTKIIKKLVQLAKAGASIIIDDSHFVPAGMDDGKKQLNLALAELTKPNLKVDIGTFENSSFDSLNIARDFACLDQDSRRAGDIAWTHRAGSDFDLYFVSNQRNEPRILSVSMRASNGAPQFWDPLTGKTKYASKWERKNGRMMLPLKLEANGSIFIVMKHGDQATQGNKANWPEVISIINLDKPWKVSFDPEYGGPEKPEIFSGLYDWRESNNFSVKNYSGTAAYTQKFDWKSSSTAHDIWLEVGKVYNLAEVYVNGIDCGVAWTAPYRVNISKALKPGTNEIRIEVTNTWSNRLTADAALPLNKRITWTIESPVKMKGRPLLPAGLIGPVTIVRLKH